MKLIAYLALIGVSLAQDDPVVYDDFYGIVGCKTNKNCDDNKDTIKTVLDDIPSLLDDERDMSKGLRCSTPKRPGDDEYDYASYDSLAEDDEGNDIRVCVPTQWCFNPDEENIFNLEYEGVRDLILFDGCKATPKPADCGCTQK